MINETPIQITEKFRLTFSKNEFIVQELIERTSRKDDSKTEIYVNYGYYGRLQQALNAILQQEAKHAEASTIQDIISHLNTVEQRIIEVVNNIGVDLKTFNEMYKSEESNG